MSTPLKLAIEGMHCGGCVTRVTNALSKVDGVEVGKVEIGSAQVVYDESKATPQQVAEAVNRIGFTAREA
jgi:copper chaperone CopZ